MRAASANNTLGGDADWGGWLQRILGWRPGFRRRKGGESHVYPATFALSPCFGGFLLASGKALASSGEYERTMDKQAS